MKAYLDRANLDITPVAAYGLVVLLLVSGGLGLEKFAKRQNSLETRLTSRQVDLATLNAIKNTEIWPERLAQSVALKEKSKDKVWSGATSGVIAARLQSAMHRISQQHNVKNMSIKVDPETIELDGVEVLRFEYSGRIPSGKDTIDFYIDLAMHKGSIIISELNINNSIRDARPTFITMSGLIPITLISQEGTQKQ